MTNSSITDPASFSANDWFYMKSECEKTNCNDPKNSSDKCCLNKSAVDNLKNYTNSYVASTTQYNDTKMLYNRELLFTINILFGLGLICYYIYINQSVIPSFEPTKLGESIQKMTSSVTTNLPKQPNLPMK